MLSVSSLRAEGTAQCLRTHSHLAPCACALTCASRTLAGSTLYYFGYNEKGMCSLYVNLVAAFAYYAKMASHISGDPVKGNVVYYQALRVCMAHPPH